MSYIYVTQFVGDLAKRNSQIRELLKKFKAVEDEAVDSSSALETSRQHLHSLEDEHKTACEQLRKLEVGVSVYMWCATWCTAWCTTAPCIPQTSNSNNIALM